MLRQRRATPLWIAILLLLLLPGEILAAREVNLEFCAKEVLDRPEDLESYRCYWALSRRGKSDEAMRALEAMLAIDPANSKARLYLAAVEADLGLERAEATYREAARGFASERNPTGETYAWISIGHLAFRDDRLQDAEEAFERAATVAEAADDPILKVRGWVMSAMVASKKGNSARGLELLLKAESVAFPDGPQDLRSAILEGMGSAYWKQGLYGKARSSYERQAELCAEHRMVYTEATARFNVALLSQNLVLDDRMSEEELLAAVQRAHELAIRAGNRSTQSRTELLLGRLLGGKEGIEHAERSLQLARATGYRAGARESMRFLAELLLVYEPARIDEAFDLLDESIEDSRQTGNLEDLALGLVVRARLLAGSGERQDWIDAYHAAIEAVEKIRDLQPDGTVGARLFSRWTHAYYRFAAELLDRRDASPDPEGDLDLALQIIERMRSRVLIDELDGARIPQRYDRTSSEAVLREEILGEIAEVQKRLSDPSLAPGDRVSALEELERLEVEEAAVRDALARVDPGFATVRAPVIPRLERIQERLETDQAIVSFQIAPGSKNDWGKRSRYPSWVVVVTSDRASAFRIPDWRRIRDRVRVFLGFCRRRDGSEAAPAARLFDDLLAEPLGTIDPAVKRLIVVPDLYLNYLPFAALRPDPDGEPLGATHEISQVPSIRLWLRWQERKPDASGRAPEPAALVLADPETGIAAGDSGIRAGEPWIEGLNLGPLPHARAEARTVVRNVGGASRALVGLAASESFLKSTELREFGILHFAAHAVVDPQRPERSAIFLAPGETDEDGFLQPREIADIDLGDKVVVLSSCRSASGAMLPGEGMLGLARAFFQAGAHAVVASLWPLRDDEARIFMSALSEQLADGKSLSASVSAVRSARLRAGAPTDAWAGLVVLGNGDIVPVPGGRQGSPFSRGWILAGLALVVTVGVAAWRAKLWRERSLLLSRRS